MSRGALPSVALRAICLTIGGLLLVAACAGGSTTADPGTSPKARSSSPGISQTPSQTPSETPSESANVADIVVSVKDGKVSPKPHRVKVAEGSSVRILMSSDIDDEVHVHGYEIEREVSAGQSTTIEFTADQTGVFEVETHEEGLLLLQLQVR